MRRIGQPISADRAEINSGPDRAAGVVPLREGFEALREVHPLPPATGEVADKAFFDELSGET